jgi:methylamine dehydrogenase accessory protein MauD
VAFSVAVVVPLAELAVALALVAKASAWWGALGAVVLLMVFLVGIGVNLARGKRPDCHCFGQLYSEPVGWRTLARNGVLVVLAGLIVSRGPSHPGSSAVAWVGDLTAAQAVGLAAGMVGVAVLAVQGWLILHLLRQNGRLLLRLDALEAASTAGRLRLPSAGQAPAGLPVGMPAPAFELPSVDGKAVSLGALRAAGRPVLLLFTDPRCGPCNALLSEVARWQQAHADRLTIAIVSRGTVEENQAEAQEHGLGLVLLQQDREVAARYQAPGTPSAVIVGVDGSIASSVAAGADAIRALLSDAPASLLAVVRHAPGPAPPSNGANGHVSGPALRPGDSAPPIELADLDGAPLKLADFRDTDTVVLFWNPGCGFCQQMLPDLKAWEQERPTNAPVLLVISTGSVEDNRAQGIRSPLVLDQGFATGRAFGVGGTPMAILVNADGKIASPLAAGAQAVLALLHAEVPAVA